MLSQLTRAIELAEIALGAEAFPESSAIQDLFNSMFPLRGAITIMGAVVLVLKREG